MPSSAFFYLKKALLKYIYIYTYIYVYTYIQRDLFQNMITEYSIDIASPSGAGCSSGGRSVCCKGLEPHAWRINPAW